ncbi:MAG TPA: type II toxin-antitoxin system VapC family toxin [Azospirillaceae bacterium]|nr:type II toxin-antitoxin system VapC family toxin [Azospirillaceae bacterium]
MIVADRRGIRSRVEAILAPLAVETIPVTPDASRLVADAYARSGKGVHPAALNLDDCFADAPARERACSLLHIGEDFARTAIRPAHP